MYKQKYEYNEDSVTSIISTTDGIFKGVARCHPEDKEIFRSYIGEKIALNRSNIAYINNEIKKTKIRLSEIEHMLNVLKGRPQYDPKNKETLVIQRRYWKLQEEITDWNIAMDMLRSEIGDLEHAANKFLSGLKRSKEEA